MRVGNRQHGSFIRTCGRFIHDSSRSASMCWSFKHNGTNTMERVTGDLSNAQAQRVTAKPNIVFILADDMRKDDLTYRPKTHSLLREQGMGFRNAFVSNPLCAPSRSSIMRGQYSHNTGVWSNSSTDSPSISIGGWQAYRDNGNERDNVATRLHDAGYGTALFGKYLNGYTDTTFMPRGWDRWFATFSADNTHYFAYNVNDQGTIRHFGTRDIGSQTSEAAVLRRDKGSLLEEGC